MTKIDLLKVIDRFKAAKEPALSGGSLIGSAVVFIYVAFQIAGVSDDILNTTITVLSFLAPVVAGLLIRFRVWSPASVRKLADELQQAFEAQQKRNANTELPNKPDNINGL